MPRFGKLLVSAGFLWMSLWAVIGSLMGAKINSSLFHADEVWLGSLQRELFRTAHSHMNTMSYAIILMGVTSGYALKIKGEKFCSRVGFAAFLGMVLFGVGLLLEAFFPTERQNFSPIVLLTALGGTALIACFSIWGFVFLWGGIRQR